MFLKVIACEIAFREICSVAARSKNLVDFDFLSQGYHDNPDIGRTRIQEWIDAVEPGKFDAILLGYGLCNNMLVGIVARDLPLIIPRAHDCITFFLGSKERYSEHFFAHPGTYYYTSGWIEHRSRGGERVPKMQNSGLGREFTYQQLVEEYGEENAKYLMEVMGGWRNHYTHGTLIDYDFTKHLNLQSHVCEICRQNGWTYEQLEGDLCLLRRWIDGEWEEEDFLVIPPGQSIVATYDDRIISHKENPL
ncbi:MAG: DUF1638 domain-containing protein [Candidatus Latescibacteria bacterium]|nr:DUF1638 domain-containing protein [Candidatus Latescibacterota bacterium]